VLLSGMSAGIIMTALLVRPTSTKQAVAAPWTSAFTPIGAPRPASKSNGALQRLGASPVSWPAASVKRGTTDSSEFSFVKLAADYVGQMMAVVASLLLAFAAPLAATARDGSIAPPTCVAILNAQVNCPAREGSGSIVNIEGQLKDAIIQLAVEEEKRGGPLKLSDAKGIPKLKTEAEEQKEENVAPKVEADPDLRESFMGMVDFYRDEKARLISNRDSVESLRSSLAKNDSARFLSKLTLYAKDLKQEIAFWTEAIGMQKYGSLPDGGVIVAFGPPNLGGTDEGGFFALELRPTTSSASSSEKAPTRLSFVQIATPSLIRMSKIISTGSTMVDGYGYFGLISPGGVQVRAYVDDRRDPVELIALVGNDSDKEAAQKSLEKLGLKPRGAYKMVSPQTQNYMPTLPGENQLYAEPRAGVQSAKNQVQVLLLQSTTQAEAQAKKAKAQAEANPLSFIQNFRGISWQTGNNGLAFAEELAEIDMPTSPVSQNVGGVKLTMFGGGSTAAASITAEGSSAVSIDLMPASKAP